MSNNTGGPAFPFGQISEVTGQPVNGFYDPGMSLRDYFAAKALQGLCANPDLTHTPAVDLGYKAVVYAEAALAELERRDV